MKLATHKFAVIMALVVAVTAGITYLANDSLELSEATTQSAGAYMIGNVKVTQTDENGNIIAYRQGTNHIVKTGLEIIIGQVFRGMNTSNTIPVHPIDEIDIGTGGVTNRLLHNDTGLADPVSLLDVSCLRQTAVTSNVTNPGSSGAPSNCNDGAILCAAQYNVSSIATFDGDDCAPGIPINEAGIFDQTSGLMFARNNFGGVVLTPGDSLALDWEFTFTDALP